ncbi:MAG: hypothetical protein MZW92_12320 [Comamonadaceae bacterium]|nr:hypothetical protein [Comamonadaceae bacterium]
MIVLRTQSGERPAGFFGDPVDRFAVRFDEGFLAVGTGLPKSLEFRLRRLFRDQTVVAFEEGALDVRQLLAERGQVDEAGVDGADQIFAIKPVAASDSSGLAKTGGVRMPK